jgi:glycosyltransferase involved in cell wall biosynthesis
MEKINVITRTSNRPNGFDRNYHSIKSQTYKNINHIVIYDNPDDYTNYVSKYDGITVYGVDRQKLIDNYKGPIFYNKMFWPSYHNLYFNPVLQTIDEGWVIFLDDDDFFTDETTVEKIVNNLQDEDTMYIWKMIVGSMTVIPRQDAYTTKKFSLGNIGGSCFTVHSKWAKKCEWDGFKCGDFRYIQSLDKIVPNKEWIDEIFIVVPQSGFGKRVDNSSEY